MSERPDLATALIAAASLVNAPHDTGTTLRNIALAARDVLPGIDHVGISLAHRDGSFETSVATDHVVLRLDHLQYELGEGPCLQSMSTEEMVVVPHLADERRWPRYLPLAVDEGLRSQVAVPLRAGTSLLGGLNLYSTSSDTVHADTTRLAPFFTTQAALVLDRARREDELQQALSSRTTIGQALGIVMERYQLDQDRAFSYLVRVSQTSNIKLRDVAVEIVSQTGGSCRPRRTDRPDVRP